jgi:hypothetical protein
MHSSILRRIWLNFMAQYLVFSALIQFSIFSPDFQHFQPEYHWWDLSSRNAHLVHQNWYGISFTWKRHSFKRMTRTSRYRLKKESKRTCKSEYNTYVKNIISLVLRFKSTRAGSTGIAPLKDSAGLAHSDSSSSPWARPWIFKYRYHPGWIIFIAIF